MNKLIIKVLLLVSLTACAEKNELEVLSKPVEISIAQPVDPESVKMLPVNFRVLTKDNIDAFLQEVSKQQNNTPVFVAFTIADYENLVLNFADLRRYIEQQQAIIVYYKAATTTKK